MSNRFKDADTVKSVVFQAIGAGSACWESLCNAGVFQSDEAERIGEEAVQRISELTGTAQ